MKKHPALTILAVFASTVLIASAQSFTPEQLEGWLTAAAGYETGKDKGPLVSVEKAVVEASGDSSLRATVEDQLLKALDTSSTKEGASFLCRMLVIAGSAKCIPSLEKKLTDPKTSHMARFVLGGLEYPEAARALHRALGRATGEPQIGIIHTLGDLRYEPAVKDLAGLLKGSDSSIAESSARGLGRIGGSEAVKALRGRRPGAAPGLRQAIDNALIHAAEQAVRSGRNQEAGDIYASFYAPQYPVHFRLAGLRGMMALPGAGTVALLEKAIQDDDASMRRRVIGIMTEAKGPEATKTFTRLLPTLSAESQVLMMSMLAVRGDVSATPAVSALLKSDDATVRLAALDALGELGGDASVPVLVVYATDHEGAERDRAQSSLNRLDADSANTQLAGLLAHEHPKIRMESLHALAARSAAEHADRIMAATKDAEREIRLEAMKALRKLAGSRQVSPLLDLMIGVDDDAYRDEVERTLALTVPRLADPDEAVQASLTALQSAKSSKGKAAVLRVLGKTGNEKALAPLYEGAKSADGMIEDAAIRSLAGWPDAGPGETLRKIALDESNSKTHRVLALRSYIDKIGLYPDVDDQEILRRYEEAMIKALRAEEAQLVLSKLSEIRHPDALKLAERVAGNPALKGSADAAAKKIKALLAMQGRVQASHNGAKANNAIDGNPGSRWDTGAAQTGGEWFSIDQGFAQSVTGLVLDTRGSNGDYPRGYEVYASPNSVGRGALVAKGKGTGPVTEIKFKEPVKARTLTIVQTGEVSGLYWSIHELTVRMGP